jgi:very-short-patch-repair endonuclease
VSIRSNLPTGVFIGSHAVAGGVLTAKELRTSSYRRLVQGVYADPGLPFDHRLRCRGVALLLPPGAAIGGRSAAGWYGAPLAGVNDPVTVLRPPTVQWKGPRGIRVHRSDLSPDEVVEHDHAPVTSALRTAWDVAALEPLGTAVAALDGMVRSGALDASALTVLAAGRTGRWGVRRVRQAFALIDPRAESAPESWVRVALVLAGLEPVPQHEIVVDGRFLARVDFAWPEAKVALEYEGAYHFDGVQILRDDARYSALVAAGWTVIRISAPDLRNLDSVVERVRMALAGRRQGQKWPCLP